MRKNGSDNLTLGFTPFPPISQVSSEMSHSYPFFYPGFTCLAAALLTKGRHRIQQSKCKAIFPHCEKLQSHCPLASSCLEQSDRKRSPSMLYRIVSQLAFNDPALSLCMLYAVLTACCCLQGGSAIQFLDISVICLLISTFGAPSNTAGGGLSAVCTIQSSESRHYQHQLRRHPIFSTIVFDRSKDCHLQHTLD